MADKELVWLNGEIKTPPFSDEARRTMGYLLRYVQQGHPLGMPDARPMPSIGAHCHELRVRDPKMKVTWRLIYRIDRDAILIGDVFAKKTQQTPQNVIEACRRRFARHDRSQK
ncbi:MAG TPA: type II toxin-antitoxin system RelE/ParE family toxin [Phycisphaerae bacterium]|nr:type II toxin-antitoxin system RelE/ParE family toxin [Phycisphaerae bacterium]